MEEVGLQQGKRWRFMTAEGVSSKFWGRPHMVISLALHTANIEEVIILLS